MLKNDKIRKNSIIHLKYEKQRSNIISSNNKKLEKAKEKDYSIFNKKFILFRKVLIYKIIIIFIYLGSILSKEIPYSKIILKFNNANGVSILGRINDISSAPSPNEVYINGENQSQILTSYNYKEDINNVTLIWKKKINTTNRLFYHCQQITEIDLSHFDTSEVISMSEMFSGCTELTSVNLANLNASKLTETQTQDIFVDCPALKYINFNKAILKDSNEFDDHIFDLLRHYGTDNFVLCINDEKNGQSQKNN